MKTVKNIPELINWTQGMKLSQHHFQESFKRPEYLLRYSLDQFIPFYWGLSSIKLNTINLPNGIFEVTSLEAVMPDGLAVHFEQSKKENLKIDLNLYQEIIQKKATLIFLVISTEPINVESSKGKIPRYNIQPNEEVLDDTTLKDPVIISRKLPFLRLVVGDEGKHPKYTGFPIAKVMYQDANYSLLPFAPPQYKVEQKSEIHKIYGEIIEELRHKANFLSEKLQMKPSNHSIELTLETKETLQGIVRNLPQLEILYKSNHSHPFLLYQNLAGCIGSLSMLDPYFVPPPMPSYDHHDLLFIFEKAQSYILGLLQKSIKEDYTKFSFNFDPEIQGFSFLFPKEFKHKEFLIGLPYLDSEIKQNLKQWFERSIISSKSVLDSVKLRRVSGPNRKRITGSHSFIPLKNLLLFSIEIDPNYIKKGETLHIESYASEKKNNPETIFFYIQNEETK